MRAITDEIEASTESSEAALEHRPLVSQCGLSLGRLNNDAGSSLIGMASEHANRRSLVCVAAPGSTVFARRA